MSLKGLALAKWQGPVPTTEPSFDQSPLSSVLAPPASLDLSFGALTVSSSKEKASLDTSGAPTSVKEEPGTSVAHSPLSALVVAPARSHAVAAQALSDTASVSHVLPPLVPWLRRLALTTSGLHHLSRSHHSS